MRKLVILCLFCCTGYFVNAQVERENPRENPRAEQEFQEKKPPTRPSKSSIKSPPRNQTRSSVSKRPVPNKGSAAKGARAGKKLTVKNQKSGKEVHFYAGDKAIIVTKKGERLKGSLKEIKGKKFGIKDTILETKDVARVKRTMGTNAIQKLTGTGLFIGGSGVTAGGVAVAYYATSLFTLGGPFIIVTAAGITAAIAIDIVGGSIIYEGGKRIIQKNSYKMGKKWFIKA